MQELHTRVCINLKQYPRISIIYLKWASRETSYYNLYTKRVIGETSRRAIAFPFVMDKTCILVYNDDATMSFEDIHLTFRFFLENEKTSFFLSLSNNEKREIFLIEMSRKRKFFTLTENNLLIFIINLNENEFKLVV